MGGGLLEKEGLLEREGGLNEKGVYLVIHKTLDGLFERGGGATKREYDITGSINRFNWLVSDWR